MAYTVLIPARLASTRLPNKPLADIAGQPMIVRCAQQRHESRGLHFNQDWPNLLPQALPTVLVP